MRDLRLLFTGLIVSATGSWAYNVGLLALVYERTHSLVWIGAAGLARFVPALIASPYGGVIAERTERIRLMVIADVLCAVWQIGLVLVAVSGAPIGIALGLSALTSVTNVVYNPAVAATIPAMVTESDLVAANALNGTIDNLVVIAGPAVGAVLIVLGSPSWTFAVNAASFAVSALIVARIRTRSRPVDVTEKGTVGPFRQMLVGMRTILHNTSARPLVGLCALASFLYGTDTVLFVAVSQQRLGTGSEGFGYLLAGLGIGHVQPACARMQKKDPLAVHPRRVWQSETADQRPAAGNFDQAAAILLDGTPPGRRIRFRQGGDVSRLAVDHREPVQVTAVLGAQGRHERRPPAWGEAVMRVQRDQAGEESIHDPELTPDPGRLVRLDVTGEVGRARQEAGVMVSDGLELAGNVRGIPQKPHLLARADGDRSRLDGDTRGPLELMKRQHQPPLPGRHDHQVARLVGGDQDRQAQLRQ